MKIKDKIKNNFSINKITNIDIKNKFIDIKDKFDFKGAINYKYSKKYDETLQEKSFKVLGIFLVIMILCTMLSRFTDTLTVPIVEVENVRSRTIIDEVKANGKIVKNREDKIKVTENLKVNHVNVSVGSTVKKGDVIAEVDVEDIKEKVEKINKDIQKGQRNISRANEDYSIGIAKKRDELNKALKDMNDSKKALDDYSKVENKDQVQEETLKVDYEAKKTQYNEMLKQSNDNIDLSRAVQDAKDASNLDEYNKELSKLTPYINSNGKILAPRDGIVTSVFAQNGGVTTDAIASLADASDGYKFVAQLESSKRNLVKNNQEVEIKLFNGDKIEEKLIIESISQSNENPEMLDVTVILPVEKGQIDDLGEMLVSSESIEYENCVPMGALRQGDNGYYVLVMEEKETVLGNENIAKKIDVKVLEQDNEFAAVNDSTISRNDKIIVNSNKNIESGDRVRLEEK